MSSLVLPKLGNRPLDVAVLGPALTKSTPNHSVFASVSLPQGFNYYFLIILTIKSMISLLRINVMFLMFTSKNNMNPLPHLVITEKEISKKTKRLVFYIVLCNTTKSKAREEIANSNH